MTLWKHQNRSGDLPGPNCLTWTTFQVCCETASDTHDHHEFMTHIAPRPSRAIQLYSAIQRYTALYSAIHYTAIYRYTLYNLYNTPLSATRRSSSPLGRMRPSLLKRSLCSCRQAVPSISGRGAAQLPRRVDGRTDFRMRIYLCTYSSVSARI